MILGIGPRVDWKTKTNKQLVAGFLELQTADEVERFLRDLMTPTEIKEFANRLEAARLLSRDVQYNAISESTGLSSTTIARIAKWLYGSLGGYRLILKRITLNQSKLGTGHSNSSQLRKGLSWN
ncbi:DNA-binding transcriptional regulator [Candidatus Nomurabacteria bacterium]|nr:DNA-binding transcriptional regulator [Candidatus Nomurabacteria bacterium]